MTELKPAMTTREILHTYFKTGEKEDDKKIEILMDVKWVRQDILQQIKQDIIDENYVDITTILDEVLR